MKVYSDTIRRYVDGVAIGWANLTEEQYANYKAMSQRPERTIRLGADRIIRLGAMPHNYYDLKEEHQDTHEDTQVYLD